MKHPEIAKRWSHEHPGQKNLPAHAHGGRSPAPAHPAHLVGGKAVVDEKLWKECQAVVPKMSPPSLPHLCGTIDSDIKVYLVDGNLVKIHHDPDFVEGGNGEEDPGLCGPKEIFLDGDHALSDLTFVLMHEAVERRKMIELKKAHPGMSRGERYRRAHIVANQIEMYLRRQASGGANGKGQAASAPQLRERAGIARIQKAAGQSRFFVALT